MGGRILRSFRSLANEGIHATIMPTCASNMLQVRAVSDTKHLWRLAYSQPHDLRRDFNNHPLASLFTPVYQTDERADNGPGRIVS